ncbi:MAG: biotin synthase BioB, partial [Streptomyces sp.]|nr:biotin synthase BioB [Streptomyces sp.]
EGAGADAGAEPAPAAVPAGAPAAGARTDLVAVRRRGVGTDLPPNA